MHSMWTFSRNGMSTMSWPVRNWTWEYRFLYAMPSQGIYHIELSMKCHRYWTLFSLRNRHTVTKREQLIRLSPWKYQRISLLCRSTALFRECTWSCSLLFVSPLATMWRSSNVGRGQMRRGVSLTRWPTVKVNRMGLTYPKWLPVLICHVGYQTIGISSFCPVARILPRRWQGHRQTIRQAPGFRTMSVAYFPTPICAFTKALILCYTAKYLISANLRFFLVNYTSPLRKWTSCGCTCPSALIGCLLRLTLHNNDHYPKC